MKKAKKILLAGTAVILLTVLLFLYYMYDIQSIEGQTMLSQLTSPQGTYTAAAYLNNGGATTSFAVLVRVTDNRTGKQRNVYWQYKCQEAEMEWESDTVITVNGVTLDVVKDAYDFRRPVR